MLLWIITSFRTLPSQKQPLKFTSSYKDFLNIAHGTLVQKGNISFVPTPLSYNESKDSTPLPSLVTGSREYSTGNEAIEFENLGDLLAFPLGCQLNEVFFTSFIEAKALCTIHTCIRGHGKIPFRHIYFHNVQTQICHIQLRCWWSQISPTLLIPTVPSDLRKADSQGHRSHIDWWSCWSGGC